MIAAAHRLAFLSWIANQCANQWKILLIIVALCAIAASAILSGIKGTTANIAWPVIGMVVAVLLYRVLWEGPSAFEKASKSTFKLKRFVYRYLRRGMPLGGATSVSVRAGLIVNQHFTSVSFRRRDQHLLADKIVAGIKKGSKLFVIEGLSGVGKTSAAIVVLDRIITDTTVSEHAKEILYCDLAAGIGDGVRDLLNRGNAGLLEQAFLILDNFHRMNPERLRDLSEFLRDGVPPCQVLLLLTQPQEFMAFCPEKNVDPLRIAEAGGALYRLAAPKPLEIQQTFSTSKDHDHIARALDALGVSYETPTRWVAHASMERAYQMALDDGNLILNNLLLVPSKAGELPDLPNSLIRVIAAISVLALHRGVFSRKELDACFARLAPNKRLFNSDLRHLHSDFQRLRRAGLVLEAIGRRRVYVFHQTLAEYFRDRFSSSAEFMNAFRTAGAEIRNMNWVKNDPLMRWLFAVELTDSRSMLADFSAAMMSGAFGQMRRALDRNVPPDMDIPMDYVRGVLAEKVGAWEDAKRWLRTAITSSGVHGNDWAKARLAQIEAMHGSDACHDLEIIFQSYHIEALYRISAKYWLIHLDAHLGRFKIDEMRAIVQEIEDGLTRFEAEDPYQLLHLARRAYFDLVRFHYLTGTTNDKFLREHSSRDIARYLSRNLVTFDAYCEKFLYGHRIHYDFVFQLRCLHQRPDLSTVPNLLPLEASDNLSTLISAAIEHYQLSAKIFSTFGDKTSEYIAPRIYELELMRDDADLDMLLPQLNEYKKFIDNSGLAELHPYPDVYYCKFHLKRAQQLLLRIRTLSDGSLASAEYDVEMRNAYSALERARVGFENSGNQYGLCMCRLYSGTLALLCLDDAAAHQGDIAGAKEIAEQFGYQRILSAIKRLNDRPLSPGHIYDAVLYFPFVHQ